jgi:hypothetical protein
MQKDFDEDDNLRSHVHLLLPATSLHACSTFTDTGLQQLAVLDTTINCLAVHASYADLASLNRLTELRIEMVGEIRLPDSSLGEVGLPMLPKLQRMVLYTNVSCANCHDWGRSSCSVGLVQRCRSSRPVVPRV